MKNFLKLYLLFFIIPCFLISQSNPYNLKIISDLEEYKKLVQKNPNKLLIDIKHYIPEIVLDIRYATTNNFTKEQIYTLPKAFLRKPVADSLKKVQMELSKIGLGIKVFDAYRPYSATLKFYEVFPDTTYVAAPWRGSRHNYGCAVDLTLIELKTGRELRMPTEFDDFTSKAHHDYNDLPKDVIENRELLRKVMEKYGFKIYPDEWWHYDFYDWQNYEILDIQFEKLVNN